MSFHRDGFEIVDDFISEPHLLNILSELELSGHKICGGGLRSPEKVFDAVKSLIDSHELLQRAESYLGSASYFVRAILFDKTPSNNWLVSWHHLITPLAQLISRDDMASVACAGKPMPIASPCSPNRSAD